MYENLEQHHYPQIDLSRKIQTIKGKCSFIGQLFVYNGQVSETTKNPEGVGIRVLSNGHIMEGCWANDKLNGYGRTITSQGCYIGDFKDDMMHGYGSLTLRNGEKYVGQ